MKLLIQLFIFYAMNKSLDSCNRNKEGATASLPDGFVYISDLNPNIIINLRYYGLINFVGSVVDGYKANRGILTKEAAEALNNAWKLLDNDGYNLVVYDAYRPQKAVDNFVRWANSTDYNQLMKLLFFPFIDHDKCFDLGYIALKSGHTRGSTIDLTIIKKDTQLEPLKYTSRSLTDDRIITYLNDNTVDMGSSFDLFDLASWSKTSLVNQTAQDNREYLINIMKQAGFNNYEQEWWHFTLANEPYPNTYFNFDVE